MANRWLRNFQEMRALGFAVVLRHLGRWRTDRRVKVSLRGIGPMYLRKGDSDFNSVRQVFVYREYDLAFVPQLDARVKARYEAILAGGGRPVIADLGANVGAASLWFIKQFPQAKIAAVEPDPENFELLQKNVAPHSSITPIEAAIGSEPGFVALDTSRQSWGVRTVRAQSGVPVRTMEEVMLASGGDTPFIAKVDIEGFESELFAKNTDWIEQTFLVIVEPHDWMMPGSRTSQSFQKAMAKHDFEMFILGENILYARI